MKKYTVLVTGIGAIIGYGIIKSLRACKEDIYIIGMDIYNDAVGQAWCDEFIQAMPANQDHYIEWLQNLIVHRNIDLVFLGIEPELYRIHDAKISPEFSKKIVLNSQKTIEYSRNKWTTIQMLKENGIRFIPSEQEGDFNSLQKSLGEKFLLKPVSGAASKGIVVIEDQYDLEYWKKKTSSDYLFQKIIGNDEQEFTVGAFGLGNGELMATQIILQRKLSREGSTVKAKHIQHPDIEAYVQEIAKIIQPIGPTNFQIRIHEGECYLLEINPRISSSTSIRAAFGYNEARMCLDYYLEHKVPLDPILTFGHACRYIDEVIFYENSSNI